MELREAQRALTRQKVLDAVLDLVAEGTLDELSVPAVSKKSGVSVATIYRYFPNRDELLTAAAAEPSRQALSVSPDRQDGDDDLGSFQRAMWHEFAKNLPLLRHQVTSAAGREMRDARLVRSRELLARYIEPFGVDPRSPDGERLVSMLLLVSGSLALVELHDRQGHDVDDALAYSLWAARTLIDATAGNERPSTKARGRVGKRATSKKRGSP